MRQQRGGFTLVEVVIAATVLVIALFGILSMAFHIYRKSDVADEAITASNLASARLAYFRAHSSPFKAVGGTFYAPPAARNLVDLNQARGNNRTRLHNVWNQAPMLFVREYLYSESESRYKDATGKDEGLESRKLRHAQTQTAAERLTRRNYIEPTPMVATIDGVFPDWGVAATKPANKVEAAYPTAIDGTNPVDFTFTAAPRANEAVRGATINQMPAGIRYVREVWVQTNSPLGAPYTSGADDTVSDETPTLPAFYVGATGQAIVTSQVVRGENAAMTNGAGANDNSGRRVIRMPSWVATVTVRVFARDSRVKNILNANTADRAKNGGTFEGIGYDPARPLATAVGYFGIRHSFGN